ncbi:hypothetical protein [Haloarcula halophila]|uniref:hypothetical protein n=1 Tax=Halomicroarcula sp. GCM10025335 TaxID=3252668 RepID=UPI00360F4D24
MAYADHPASLYDEIIEDRDYITVNGTTIPIRTSVIDEITEYTGETEIHLTRPSGDTHTLTAETPIPPRDELLGNLAAAQRAFDDRPVSTLQNLFDARLGPLHYTDTTAHFTVGEAIFDAHGQHGTGPLQGHFQSLGVKAAHLSEGFKIASTLPYHWVDGVGWEITRQELYRAKMGDGEIPEDRAPPIEDCFIINVPSVFPAKSFGQATNAPAEIVNRTISRTEQTLAETLLTKRMAQLDAIEQQHALLTTTIERGNLDRDLDEVPDLDTVAQQAFGISASGLASLRSQVKDRHNKAFETVRLLSESEDFNYVMEEFAETIDELGELAMLGTRYREEVLDEPPGFY